MRAARLVLVVSATVLLGACNAILGFEEASVDPNLPQTETDTTEPLTCDSYCAAIMKNCTGNEQEYVSEAVCKAMCVHFEPGIPNKHDEDSLACRLYHAVNAAQSPAVHCKHAGPTGGGHCGEQPCNAYCLLVTAQCNGPLSPFPGGEMQCRQECAQYTYLTDPSVPDLMPSGDTLNCRVYHLESAYVPDNPAARTTHCPHTGTVSATCN